MFPFPNTQDNCIIFFLPKQYQVKSIFIKQNHVQWLVFPFSLYFPLQDNFLFFLYYLVFYFVYTKFTP